MNKTELTNLIRELPAGFGQDMFYRAGIDRSMAATPERLSAEEVQRLYAAADEIIARHGDREEAQRRQREAERGLKKTRDGDIYDLEAGLQSHGAGGGLPAGREFS